MAHKIEGWPCNFSGQVHTEQQSGPEQADEYRLLSTGQYGDFEIECRGHIFKVHKAIMSSASPFFKSAIDGPFKESRENKIDLCEDEPEIIARILILIYCGVYESGDITRGMVGMIPQFEGVTDRYAHTIESCWRDAELAVKLYTTMKRYGFSKSYSDSLRLIFLKALYNERRFETPSQDEQDDKPLKESDAALLVDLVKLVYESTEEGDWTLKDVILQNIRGLIKDFRGLESEALQQMLRDSPDITLDIASSVLKETTCKECNHSIMVRQSRCKCGCLDRCSEVDCNEVRKRRAICVWCHKFGVIDFSAEAAATGKEVQAS